MRAKKLIEILGSWVRQLHNLSGPTLIGNTDDQCKEVKGRIRDAVKEHMPSGSGFNSGTKLSLELSAPEKLVFTTEFHHMDEHGYYDGWTYHRVTVRPSFDLGINIHISGPNRNQIKDYMYEVFDVALSQVLLWNASKDKLEIVNEQSI